MKVGGALQAPIYNKKSTHQNLKKFIVSAFAYNDSVATIFS